MALNPAPQVPDGPFMSFQAIPHPLPDSVQARLKALSIAAHDSGEYGHGPAFDALDTFVAHVRDVLGVEHLRREFVRNGERLG